MQITSAKVFSVFKKHYKEIPLIPVSKTPFQTLVAVMLSARTRDETTAVVCRRLFKVAATPQKLGQLKIKELEILLYPVGFYRTKAKYLKSLAEKIVEDFGGKIPNTLEGLISLPGVGRKSANIVLARAFKIPAIGVDTHVHRIANALGWVNTKTPEQTEKELMKILPKKYWIEVNNLMVSIGQQYRSKNQLEKFLKKNGLI
ncbi:MAG: endonuclease III [bacterium]|nr:endonuclease III [bacterium]